MNDKYRVIADLPDGNGVWIEPTCALCGEVNEAVQCPICNRVFCVALCYDVHFNARDTLDAPDKIDAFLRTPMAHELLDAGVPDADWRHGLDCENCRPDLREAAVRLLIAGVKLAVGLPCE